MKFKKVKLIEEGGNISEKSVKEKASEYSANGRPLVTVEKSTQYADQVHLAQKLNTLKSPLWI